MPLVAAVTVSKERAEKLRLLVRVELVQSKLVLLARVTLLPLEAEAVVTVEPTLAVELLPGVAVQQGD